MPLMNCLRPSFLQCTSNNSYVTEFTDGKRIEMGGEELREAKKLFAAELMKLTKANVSKTNVASTEVQGSDMAKTAAQAIPLWSDIDCLVTRTRLDDVPDVFVTWFCKRNKAARMKTSSISHPGGAHIISYHI